MGISPREQRKARHSRLPAIMITGKGDIATAVAAMKAGALDFVEKPVGDRELIALIDRAFVQATAKPDTSEQLAVISQRLATLTKRQRQVLDLVIAGDANKEIAAQLQINQRTVESHRAVVMKKMGATSLAELIRLTLGMAHPRTASDSQTDRGSPK